MTLAGSVGEQVTIQFPAFDVDGLTPMTGLVDGDFDKVLLVDDAVSAQTVTVSEVGSSGYYVMEFTPDANGLWYAQVETPAEDIYADQIAVGPLTTDAVDSIADAVWSEALPGAFAADSAGERLSSTDDRVELLQDALVMAVLTAGAGSTSTVLQTAAGQVDGYYDGLTLVVRNSSGSVARRIESYSQTDGAFTIPELPFTPDTGDDVIVLGLLGEVAIAGDAALAVKIAEIHQLLGLDPENMVCISKTRQVTGDIVLENTEIGDSLCVTRTS